LLVPIIYQLVYAFRSSNRGNKPPIAAPLLPSCSADAALHRRINAHHQSHEHGGLRGKRKPPAADPLFVCVSASHPEHSEESHPANATTQFGCPILALHYRDVWNIRAQLEPLLLKTLLPAVPKQNKEEELQPLRPSFPQPRLSPLIPKRLHEFTTAIPNLSISDPRFCAPSPGKSPQNVSKRAENERQIGLAYFLLQLDKLEISPHPAAWSLVPITP